ncbi:MAG: BNR-4 repeat-containing protein [Candidatus Nealsonbacteria bacterium]|nr:BNR-4 repeat-containing protein [Candidatus Nealsonbacteria bacterium]
MIATRTLAAVWILAFALTTAAAQSETALSIGGNGGVYFLAEAGELVVDLHKRDRNRRAAQTELRAILVGPDRRVLQEVTIPDDGKPRGSGFGPVQKVRLSTKVRRKGVYALNVTTSQDRYGEQLVWGFHTNCPRYLIETSRGHKDERHQEPIVLAGSDRPADVCFLPRGGPLSMQIANLPGSVKELTVFGGDGKLLAKLPVLVSPSNGAGQASHTFAADVPRDAIPWRLHLPIGQATVHVDGVTRWDTGDLYPNLSLWTPEPASYFPFSAYRWLLTPYSRKVYGQPGEQGEVTFTVENNSGEEKTIRLELEFPGDPWPVELSQQRVALGSKGSREVTVRYTVGAQRVTRVCHLRATPAEDPEFSTYCTLTAEAGVAPAAKPLSMPLVLEPYRHENEQFGYLPDYPVESQVYFDPENRPFVRTSSGIATHRDGRWAAIDFRKAVTRPDGSPDGRSFGVSSTKIAFDRQGDVYVLARSGRQDALLHSTDGSSKFTAYLIPGREDLSRALDIEQFSGHNVPDGPPPIVRFTRTASDPQRIWRRIHDLELLLPEKTDAGLSLGEPILVSRQCIGLAAHSGIPSSVVSRGGKVHVAWAEATDPEADVPGVPTYVATYDRKTRTLGKPALVGYGLPPNDIHNSPSITIDSQGYLHVLVGTHGRPFPYARSLKPNDAHTGWTRPVPMGDGLRQTYIGLVCDRDDTLHAVFRLWRSAVEPFPASHHGTLAYQRKRPGQPWEAPRVLIVPPFSEYSVYYHRLTIDRRGRLFLSYDYWSTYWFYRNDHRGSRRALLTSPDGGETWKLAGRDLFPD